MNNINPLTPTVGIIGAGFAGLLTAINIKNDNPQIQIVIVDKPRQESNTQIAGMRIRERFSGSKATDPEEKQNELIGLLASQNKGETTAPMIEFAKILKTELPKWNAILKSIDPNLVSESEAWFGPQWGILNKNGNGGRGLSVLGVLRSIAQDQGVIFMKGEVQSLNRSENRINSISLTSENKNYKFNPQLLILANGSATGSIYESTNKNINNSATELGFNADIPLNGGNVLMYHPFGRSTKDGKPLLGCYETDLLAETTVVFPDGTTDWETTQLLRDHKAHYQFEKITQKFIENGGVVKLVDDKTKNETHARVSVHYSQLGIQTIDGTRISGIENLLAVGDASSISHITNGNIRLPGYALANGIVTAKIASDWVTSDRTDWQEEKVTIVHDPEKDERSKNLESDHELRRINTEHVIALDLIPQANKEQILKSWTNELDSLGPHHLQRLTHSIIDGRIKALNGETEPIIIKGEGVNENNNRSELKENNFLPLGRRL